MIDHGERFQMLVQVEIEMGAKPHLGEARQKVKKGAGVAGEF